MLFKRAKQLDPLRAVIQNTALAINITKHFYNLRHVCPYPIDPADQRLRITLNGCWGRLHVHAVTQFDPTKRSLILFIVSTARASDTIISYVLVIDRNNLKYARNELIENLARSGGRGGVHQAVLFFPQYIYTGKSSQTAKGLCSEIPSS